jgi:hypothetical protein
MMSIRAHWIACSLYNSLVIAPILLLAQTAAGHALNEFQKITASDAGAGDHFGHSVAISSNTAIVGASLDGAGSAYLYRETSGTWSQVARLIANDRASNDRFGTSAAISGSTAVVSAYLDDHVAANAGSAYVFRNNGGSAWNQIAKLVANDAAENGFFGWSVALSGNTIIAGAPGDDDTAPLSGAAYVFRESTPGTWGQVAKLTASDAAESDLFGWSVALSGNTAIIGALNGVGAAYIFQENGFGTWSQVAKLTANDAAAGDFFGTSVDIESGMAVVGAIFGNAGMGAAYVFEDFGSGMWSQVATLSANDAADIAGFGVSVALSDNKVLVGAEGDNDDPGSAYVFSKNGLNIWQQMSKLTASDGANGDSFGGAVALSGNLALVGASLDDDAGNASGTAFLFQVPEPGTFFLSLVLALGLLAFERRRWD